MLLLFLLCSGEKFEFQMSVIKERKATKKKNLKYRRSVLYVFRLSSHSLRCSSKSNLIYKWQKEFCEIDVNNLNFFFYISIYFRSVPLICKRAFWNYAHFLSVVFGIVIVDIIVIAVDKFLCWDKVLCDRTFVLSKNQKKKIKQNQIQIQTRE